MVLGKSALIPSFRRDIRKGILFKLESKQGDHWRGRALCQHGLEAELG